VLTSRVAEVGPPQDGKTLQQDDSVAAQMAKINNCKVIFMFFSLQKKIPLAMQN